MDIKKKNSTKDNMCSDFEEMLMWTSYRYCIGRHTYVVTMAGEIGRNYYNRLTNKQKEHAAADIRKMIADQLNFEPFNFKYEYIYDGKIQPIADFVDILEKEGIDSVGDLLKCKSITCYWDYEEKVKKHEVLRSDSVNRHYFSPMDIDDLIPWENLASFFDMKNHVIVKGKNGEEYECFKAYERKHELVEDKGDMKVYRNKDFGWECHYVAVDDYLKRGNYHAFIVDNMIESVEPIQNSED